MHLSPTEQAAITRAVDTGYLTWHYGQGGVTGIWRRQCYTARRPYLALYEMPKRAVLEVNVTPAHYRLNDAGEAAVRALVQATDPWRWSSSPTRSWWIPGRRREAIHALAAALVPVLTDLQYAVPELPFGDCWCAECLDWPRSAEVREEATD